LGTLLERTVALGFRPHKVDVTHDVLSVTNTTLPTLRAAVDPSTRGGDYYGPAYELFAAELEPELNRSHTPAERLAAMARAYVRFAGTHHALFQVLFEAGIDKGRHPEVAAAELPIDDAFHDSVRVLSDAAASEPWRQPWRPQLTATRCCSSTDASGRARMPWSSRPNERPAQHWPSSRVATYLRDVRHRHERKLIRWTLIERVSY
jgi:hypothetical protein